jgi:UDP-glucose 4-epimerase
MLEAARQAGVRRFMFAASSSAYGETVELPKHEAMLPSPLSPYAAAKLAGEHYVHVYARTMGLDGVSLRYFNVFGPRQDPSSPYSGVISVFAKAMREGRRPVVYGDGGQTRDFLYVDDLCRAVIEVLNRQPQGELFQLGTGTETSVSELVERLIALFPDRDVQVRHEPARAGEIARSFSDISHAREELGYDPSVGLDEGLAVTREWFVNAPRA